MIYAKIILQKLTFELWFDPSVNYLVRKEYVWHGTMKLRAFQVERFIEDKPGIFFPQLVKGEGYKKDGTVSVTRRIVFTDLTINEPFPESLRQLRFPPGIRVVDTIKNEIFKTDEHGEPTLPFLNAQGQRVEMGSPGGAGPPPVVPAKTMIPSTEEEPRAWTDWLLPASLMLLFLAGAMSLVRYVRLRNKPASPII